MRPRLSALRFTIGRRGLVLILFGIIYGLIGQSYVQGHISPTAEENLALALRWVSIEAWGVVWMVAAALALIASRWPPGRDWWGYAVLSGLAIIWSALAVAGRLIYDAPYALAAALVYGLLAAILLIIAGWPEVR